MVTMRGIMFQVQFVYFYSQVVYMLSRRNKLFRFVSWAVARFVENFLTCIMVH